MSEGAPHPPVIPHRKRLRRLLWGCVILIVFAVSGFTWIFTTESGLRALIDTVARFSGGALHAEGIEGTLHGSFSVARLSLELPKAKLALSGLACDWQPSALLDRKFALIRLRIEQADVFLRESPPSSEPPTLPESLRLPLDIDLAALEIGRLKLVGHSADTAGESDAAPLFVLSEGRLSLAGDATQFHLRQLAGTLPQGYVKIEAELDTMPPYALRANGRLEGEEFSAQLDGEGSLAEPSLRLQAQGRGAQAQVTLVATPFEALPLKTLKLNVDKVNPAAFVADLPHAELRIQANLAADIAGDGPMLRGPVKIDNARPTTLDAGGLPVSALSMEASINAALNEVWLDAFALEGGGGKLMGWLHWRKEEAEHGTVPVGFGRIKADLEAQGIDPASVNGRLPSRRVDARVEMDATEARQQGKLLLRTDGMRVTGEAEIVASAVGVPVFVLTLDLHDFNSAAFHPASPPASINLHAALSGTLAEKPAIAVHYTFDESRFNGRPLAGSGLLTWDGMHVCNADLGFDIAGNRLKLTGAWGKIQDILTLELDAPRLADVGFGLEGRLYASGFITGALEAPAGTLKADVEKLHLSDVLEISSLAGEARIEAGDSGPLALSLKASRLVAGDVSFATINLMADGQRDRHQIQARFDGKFGKDPLGLKATLEGGLQETHWQGQIAALESTGNWALRLRAPAALEIGFAPEKFGLLDAEFDINLGSAPDNAGSSRSRNSTRNTPSEPGRISLIETRWQNNAAILRGKLTGFPASQIPGLEQGGRRSPLILGADWDLRLDDNVEGQARLFRESGDFSLRGEISTRLGLERFEAYFFAQQQKVKLVLATHAREAGELGVSLEAGIERAGQGWRLAPHVPLSGAAHLDMPSLAWLGRLSRENIETDGSLVAEVTLSGTPETPDLQGLVKGRALQFSLLDQGLLLAGGQLEAGFSHHDGQQRLRLTKLEFESPNRVIPADKRLPVKELTATPGRMLVTGDIAIGTKARTGEIQRGRFEFTADRLPLLQRSDRWLIISGEGRAGLQGSALDVQAQLRADAGYIAIDDMPPPSLGDDVIVRSKDEEESASSAGGEGIAIAGNISVDLGRALYLSAYGLDTRLMGKLDVGLHPFESVRVMGVIRTIGGTWRGYGQHLKIERGAITFQGDAVNPAINITAMRRGLEVEAGVMITGDARRPQVKLVSEPAVPEHEKLSWLILGRAPDAGGSDMALLLPAAQALFGSTGGGMTENIGSKLGFDTFTIGQGELNSMRRNATSKVVGGGSRIDAGPTTESEVITVGKRLTNDLSLSFEQSLGGAESLVKLTYNISRELSLIARGGTDNALDLYYTYVLRNKERRDREKARQMEKELSESQQEEKESSVSQPGEKLGVEVQQP
ncbi:MAG: translocation/assembly module TamB domain-containing protein [Betaproteobacteria bacterium]|nr:translocation/assembly module TamB domain-containing protein [Betaproteobacteria bacterium]